MAFAPVSLIGILAPILFAPVLYGVFVWIRVLDGAPREDERSTR